VRCARGVSPAGYYAWRSRPESRRSAANRKLVDDIKRVHRDTCGRYGSPRIHVELKAQGRGVSRGRIERLMRHHGITGPLWRGHAGCGPPTAVTIFRSPRICSTATSPPLRRTGSGSPTSPMSIHHSDRGVQYASAEYRKLMQSAGFKASMSRKGDCYDNAPMESFFHTLKTELVHHRQYATRAEATRDIFAYIEGFYNRTRRHSAIGYISPIEMELKAA
jgi:putative transposase